MSISQHQATRNPDTTLSRRGFVASAAATLLATSAVHSAEATAKPKYRVGVIGHTGRGNYGHGLERVWREIPNTQVVAVADPNPLGLAVAIRLADAERGYAEYRKMLDEVKPDLVSIAPRWLDQHCEMVVAAAERGVRGIYLEKPMCRTLDEGDRMVAACQKYDVTLALAHQTRYSPKLKVIANAIAEGRLGRVIEYRARGKEDRRGGGEDLWVLGTHMLNLMTHFGGKPLSCYGTVWQDGRLITDEDVYEGNEGIGPLAGDEVHATYPLTGGATGYFDSVRNAGGTPSRFGLRIFGSEGIIEMYDTGPSPSAFFLPDSSWSPGRTKKQWIPITANGIGGEETPTDGSLHAGNVLAVQDLIAAIEEHRSPITNINDSLISTEMIVAVFESQRLGRPVDFPLENRQNPLTM